MCDYLLSFELFTGPTSPATPKVRARIVPLQPLPAFIACSVTSQIEWTGLGLPMGNVPVGSEDAGLFLVSRP